MRTTFSAIISSLLLSTAVNGASSTTFREPTATHAPPTASGPTINNGKAHLTYETLTGFFQQDDPATNSSTFQYNATNFGLIHRKYPSDTASSTNLTDWQRFNAYIKHRNANAAKNADIKLLFIARHSEGYHNAEESYVGTPAWNCYFAELAGNKSVTWEDAGLTAFGQQQAVVAHNFWRKEIRQQKIETPQSFYTSPLDRCLSTAQLTFQNLPLPKKYPFVPTVKELLREGISIHTCDRRSSRSYIENAYPGFEFESTFTDTDELWSGLTAETSSAQDYRSKVVLDDIFSHDDSSIISITSHSGEAGSLLRVLGHQPFSLVTGAIIPVLVKVKTLQGTAAPSTTTPWTTGAWCTNGPPESSISGGACVCKGTVTPTAAHPSISPRK